MTEAEWRACDDPEKLLEAWLPSASRRKLRLFACACCRSTWHLLPDWGSRQAIQVAELFCDGMPAQMSLAEAESNSVEAWDCAAGDEIWARAAAIHVADADAGTAAIWTARCVAAYQADDEWRNAVDIAAFPGQPNEPWVMPMPRDGSPARSVRHEQAKQLRDIFGNPFRPVVREPRWLPSTAVFLAATMYEEREFSCMLILADALEDAGCTNIDVLDHCRQSGEHVRGCWVVDLVLGKE